MDRHVPRQSVSSGKPNQSRDAPLLRRAGSSWDGSVGLRGRQCGPRLWHCCGFVDGPKSREALELQLHFCCRLGAGATLV